MLCKNCGFMHNTESAVFCAMCGEVLAPAAVPAMAGVGAAGAVTRPEPAEFKPFRVPPAPARPDEGGGPVSHESLLAKLDRAEQDLFSRLDEKIPAYTPESEPELDSSEALESKDDSLSSLSLTLDSLIADLLDAEMNEYVTPNLLRPDEAGFPGPSNRWERLDEIPQRRKLGHRMIDATFIIALVSAVFLLGMTVGLWSYYVMGL